VHYFNKINEVLVRQEKEVQNVLNVHVSLGYAEESKVKARGTKKKRTNDEHLSATISLYLL